MKISLIRTFCVCVGLGFSSALAMDTEERDMHISTPSIGSPSEIKLEERSPSHIDLRERMRRGSLGYLEDTVRDADIVRRAMQEQLELTLQSNGPAPTILAAVKEVLKDPNKQAPHILYINLPLGDEEGGAFVETLVLNRTLSFLGLIDSGVSNVVMGMIVNAIKAKPDFKMLFFSERTYTTLDNATITRILSLLDTNENINIHIEGYVVKSADLERMRPYTSRLIGRFLTEHEL